ncbi:ISAs1 family transposase [Chamaesiphon sp.]|uniref:ISAs1 family transposase n=1 Tax=Chamaesiphon sp. TaxID=2814140 RepID=UPI00359326A6
MQQIIDSGNDYLVAVKGNQPNLYQELNNQFEQAVEIDTDIQTDSSHGRQVQRSVSVKTPTLGIDPLWVGVQRIVKVERTGTRQLKPFEEIVFYISSLSENAAQLAARIRAHWQVENCLHWVKDVVLKEDESPLCGGSALVNFGILLVSGHPTRRTIAMNIFRKEGYALITKGIRFLAHDLDRLFSFLQ